MSEFWWYFLASVLGNLAVYSLKNALQRYRQRLLREKFNKRQVFVWKTKQ